MDKETKSIIKKINDSKSIDLDYFGEAISPILFSVDNRALCCFDDNYYLLTPNNNKNNQDLAFRKIIEVVSYLDDLEKNHYIFVRSKITGDLVDGKPYLFYEGKRYIRNRQDPFSWDIGENLCLNLKDNMIFAIEKNDRTVLQSTPLPEPIKEELRKYLFSNIYPTTKLDSYIRHGFRTNEQRALRLSIIGLLIAVIFPVLVIFLSNRWGYVTIDKEQFKQLISSQQSTDNNPVPAFPILSPKNQ